MRLLGIYATTRSGTTYMAQTLQNCDILVGHGKPDLDGAILWGPMATANQPRFTHTWHQTRDPLKTIASIAAPNGAQMFWERLNRQGFHGRGDPILLRSMRYWRWCSRCCDKLSKWQYRVEDIYDGSDVWVEICDRLHLGGMVFPNLPTNTNTREHPSLAWDDLYTEDASLAGEIAEMSESYGY